VALSPEHLKRVAWSIDGQVAVNYDEAIFEARWGREFVAL
jgi:hypothetical protein